MTETTNSTATPSSAFAQRFRDLGSLRRASDHRAVAGVAEGLSRHFDVDAIIVRVLFGALTLFGGAGLILYAALWLTVPTETSQDSIVSGRLRRDAHAWTTIGLAVGAILAATVFLGSLSWAVPHPFPFFVIGLVIVVCALALTRRGDRQPPTGLSPAPTPVGQPTPGSQPAPVAQQPASPDLVRATEPPTAVIPPTDTPADTSADTPADTPADARAWWQRDDLTPSGERIPWATPLPPPAPKRPSSHLFGMTMATVALAIAGVWIVDATSSYDVHPSVYPGIALAVIAVGLLVGAWWGRSRGLIAMGIIAAVATAAAGFVGPGPYGDHSTTPTQAGELQSSYRMGVGRFTVHLEQIGDVAALQGRDVSVNQRIGQLRVVVPTSVAAVIDATVDHGTIDGPRNVQEIDEGGEHVVMTPAAAGRPTVTLHLHVGYGNIAIERVVCPGASVLALPGETTYVWEGDANVAAACN